MNKIIPFQYLNDALSTLDNGGRFYNLLTKANDGNISQEELSKVAGLFSDKQKMVLFFAMSIANLETQSRLQVESALTDKLKLSYDRYAPQMLVASEAAIKGILSSNAIVTGIPKLVESKSDFDGFMIMPLMAGKVVTVIVVPLIDKYDVYEMRDEETSNIVLIAHARGNDKLPGKKIRAGGIFKEVKLKNGDSETPSIFLETLYYSDIN